MRGRVGTPASRRGAPASGAADPLDEDDELDEDELDEDDELDDADEDELDDEEDVVDFVGVPTT